jgi:uncharacterized protein
MKIVSKDETNIVLRFDKDEEVLTGLQAFMQTQDIEGCSFFGIGTCSSLELGYFNPNLKQYRQKTVLENLEIISFQGNGSIMEGKPVIHAHGMFGRTDFTVLGGHVFKAVTLATCEVSLTVLKSGLKRANNPDWNLNLLVE